MSALATKESITNATSFEPPKTMLTAKIKYNKDGKGEEIYYQNLMYSVNVTKTSMEQPGHRLIDGCIVFNGMKSVFYSGQVIEGKINFELNSPLDISAIDIIFLGEGNAQWNEAMYDSVKLYVAREKYCNHVLHLSQGPTVLQAGRHSIPFSYQLPFNCPSSFKGEKGQVTYSVTAHVIHQDGVAKDIIEADFSVIDPLNLNTGSADIKEPVVMEFEEQMSCQCFWASKQLGVTVRLPAHGMCPGQVVPVTVAVRNKTSVEITKIIFQITTRQRYRCQQPAKVYEPPEEVLATMNKGPILSNTHKDYVFELTVPDFIAPNMEQCSIIDVGYFFKVIIKLSGCNEDLEDEAEICMGLVPLGESSDLTHHRMAYKLPNGPIPDPTTAVNIPEYETYINEQNMDAGNISEFETYSERHTDQNMESTTTQIKIQLPQNESQTLYVSQHRITVRNIVE